MLFDNHGQASYTNNDVDNVSPEVEALILEGALMDLGVGTYLPLLENAHDMAIATKENIALERTIVRLDKNARFSQAQKIAAFSLAREKNDPKMKKLMTVWAWERHLEAFIMKKYGNPAARRARKVVQAQKTSKSNLIKVAAEKIKKDVSLDQPKMPKEKLNGPIR